MKTLIVAALVIAAPANSAVVIVCDTHTTTETKQGAAPTGGDKTTEVDRVTTYVIDDVAKTFKRLNPDTGGLDTFCSECLLEFGPKKIKLSIVGSSNPEVIFNYDLKLDRLSGTITEENLWLSLTSFYQTKGKMTGTCQKTMTPKPSAAKKKF